MTKSISIPNAKGCGCSLLTLLSLAASILVTVAAPSQNPTLNLAELEPFSAVQGWGQLERDKSVTGKPLCIGERRFAKGLGTHAHSELIYDLDGGWERFEGWVGIDAAVIQRKQASVVFKVFADERELFDSGVMRADTPAKRVSVSLAGVRELKLVVTDGGDGGDSDHADWAEPILSGRSKPVASITALRPAPKPAKFAVSSPALTVELSSQGEIVGVFGKVPKWHRVLEGGVGLARCTNSGAVTVQKLSDGGAEFSRQVVHSPTGNRATLVERFRPTPDSVRWEVEIRGHGAPWTTGIEARLWWPARDTTRFWTAWGDPEQKRDIWRDPLTLKPLINKRLSYGTALWNEEHPAPGYPPSPDAFVIPLLTVAEPESNAAMSLVLSPEDPLLELLLSVHKTGQFQFTHHDYRMSETNVVRLAMDLVPHEADWRAGLGWMVQRYPRFFDPQNPRAGAIAGLGAYSDWEGALDVPHLKKTGFRVNWKASYDFPYMGMFLPPIPEAERYTRLVKSNTTSIQQIRDYSANMRQVGFYVLNYFNVTEFGASTGMPTTADPALAPADHWKNVHNFMEEEVAGGILLDLKGHPYGSWKGCVAMDCGAPKYRAFLLEQARRHVEKLPESSGICIDRLDWLRFYNFRADDGISWRQGQPCRALYSSWRNLMADLGPLFHRADKIILVNAIVNRTDLFGEVDGIYHEMGHEPYVLNGSALQCVRRPCIAWTPGENTLKPDPDAYFQRHLYLGVFPTAPLPVNDHAITPSAWADRWYLDYGPLFDSLRERKWVLIPHVVEVAKQSAKANLFTVPDGLVMPVCFGGKNARAEIVLRHLSDLNFDSRKLRCAVLHPGKETALPLKVSVHRKDLHLDVPLERGCALVRIYREP
jgi:hypothetical protein